MASMQKTLNLPLAFLDNAESIDNSNADQSIRNVFEVEELIKGLRPVEYDIVVFMASLGATRAGHVSARASGSGRSASSGPSSSTASRATTQLPPPPPQHQNQLDTDPTHEAALELVRMSKCTQTPEVAKEPRNQNKQVVAFAEARVEPPAASPAPVASFSKPEGSNSTTNKKRRRKAPRLTRVKYEKEKRAKAKARTTGESEVSEELPQTVNVAGVTEEAPPRTEKGTHKSKGKGKAMDVPIPGSAATSLKRSRDDDVGDTYDEPPSQTGADPSRPTRRTRRRVEASVSEAPAPVAPTTRTLRSRVTIFELPAKTRGTKRNRVDAEPSGGLVQTAQKRTRYATTSAAEDTPVATSSRVTLDQLDPARLDRDDDMVMVDVEDTEAPQRDDMDENSALQEANQYQNAGLDAGCDEQAQRYTPHAPIAGPSDGTGIAQASYALGAPANNQAAVARNYRRPMNMAHGRPRQRGEEPPRQPRQVLPLLQQLCTMPTVRRFNLDGW